MDLRLYGHINEPVRVLPLDVVSLLIGLAQGLSYIRGKTYCFVTLNQKISLWRNALKATSSLSLLTWVSPRHYQDVLKCKV